MTSDAGDAVDPAHGPVQRDTDTPSVLCPNGHMNAWNYKFCGSCGAPIGVVAWPTSEDEESAGEARWHRRGLVYASSAALLALFVAVSIAVYIGSRPGSDVPQEESFSAKSNAGGSSLSVGPTVCPAVPILQTESMDLTSAGLEIQTAFTSPCGADVESNSKFVVTVAEGDRDVAAASFDFSQSPLALEPGVPGRRTLVFPRGMYWRTPPMLSAAPTLAAKREGDSRATSGPSKSDSTMVAVAVAKPAFGSIDGVAKAVLSELHDVDFRDVRSLTIGWVPQISSKRVGLQAAGKTWTNADILDEHLDLRQRFPNARLVWSGDWTTFSQPDFWVTVVGPSKRFPFEANSWCEAQGFAVDDCFAKFISSIYGVPGTTVYRK